MSGTRTSRRCCSRTNKVSGYVDVTAQHQLAGPVNDAAEADLDSDGDLDLVTVTVRAFQYQLNDAGVFGDPVEIGAVPAGGDGWAVAVADIDGDGDRDVYGMIGDERPGSNPNDVVFYSGRPRLHPPPGSHTGGLADDVVMVSPWRYRAGRSTGHERLRPLLRTERPRAGPIALFRWGS